MSKPEATRLVDVEHLIEVARKLRAEGVLEVEMEQDDVRIKLVLAEAKDKPASEPAGPPPKPRTVDEERDAVYERAFPPM